MQDHKNGPGPNPSSGALPEVLHAEHLAGVFGVSVSQARQNLAAGTYGPRFRVGKRWGILRTVMIEHLHRMSEMPSEPKAATPERGSKVLDVISRQRIARPRTA